MYHLGGRAYSAPRRSADSGVFMPDADGGTSITDPLASDSDGDEDLDADGEVDASEVDPLDPLSFPVTDARQIPLPLWALLILVVSISGLDWRRTRNQAQDLWDRHLYFAYPPFACPGASG